MPLVIVYPQIEKIPQQQTTGLLTCQEPATVPKLSKTLQIVELKTLCMPVSATLFCLNVSQSVL